MLSIAQLKLHAGKVLQAGAELATSGSKSAGATLRSAQAEAHAASPLFEHPTSDRTCRPAHSGNGCSTCTSATRPWPSKSRSMGPVASDGGMRAGRQKEIAADIDTLEALIRRVEAEDN